MTTGSRGRVMKDLKFITETLSEDQNAEQDNPCDSRGGEELRAVEAEWCPLPSALTHAACPFRLEASNVAQRR
jgi:hypothetical protein